MVVEVVVEIGVVVVIEMGTEEKEETSEAVIGQEVVEEEEDIDEATPLTKLTIRDLLENLVLEGIGQTVVGTETAEKEVTGAIGETAIKIVQTGLVIEEEVAVEEEEEEDTETGLAMVVLKFLPMHRSRLHQERCAAQQPNSSFQLICRS